MSNIMIPAEVIVHFDTAGIITPYRIRYEYEGKKIIYVSRLLKRSTSMYSGRALEIFECVGCKDNYEITFALKFEKKINQWFLTKL